jgi:hypothetical protein
MGRVNLRADVAAEAGARDRHAVPGGDAPSNEMAPMDRLYGVTMPGRGVPRLPSVDP